MNKTRVMLISSKRIVVSCAYHREPKKETDFSIKPTVSVIIQKKAEFKNLFGLLSEIGKIFLFMVVWFIATLFLLYLWSVYLFTSVHFAVW